MGFEQQVDQWRDFYLAVAGAAAVLVGLVFIALTLYLEKAELPGFPFVGLGSQALISLIYVLLLSLGMLVPYRPPVLPGIAVLTVALVGLNHSITTLRRTRRAREPHLTISALAVPSVPAGGRQRSADRQRNAGHLEAAAVRTHART